MLTGQTYTKLPTQKEGGGCIEQEFELSLPDVEPSTFGSFLVWLHSWLPYGIVDENVEETVDLAIFAEKYEVSALLLQCLHALKETWGFLRDKRGTSREWTVKRSDAASPQIIRRIFENTKDTSALRDLCASFLGGYLSSKQWCPASTDEYQPVFEKFPQLGWRVFKNQMQLCDGKWSGMHQDDQNFYGQGDEAELAHKTEFVNLGRKNWMEIQENLATGEYEEIDDDAVHD